MNYKIDISIIILNYNTTELTKACIESIYKKTLGVSFELIVVDNASTDREIETFDKIFPDIQLILNDKNLGFAKGNNIGIQHSKGESIVLLNSDTVLLNDAISICYNKLIESKNISVVSAKLLSEDGSIQHQCRAFDTIGLYLIEKLRIHKLWSPEKRARILLNGYFDHTYPLLTDRVWGTFFMFSRSIIDQFPDKKLADRFFMYGEDNEWCYQVAKYTNTKILYYPEACILHYGGGSNYNETSNNAKLEAIKKNKRAYLSDYYGKNKTKLLLWLKGE